MTQAQIRHDICLANEGVGVQKAQSRRLHRSAEIKGTTFKLLRQVGDDHFTDVVARAAVKHQAEGSFSVMLANQHHRALEERAAQLAAVQEQLAFQELFQLRHLTAGFRTHLPCRQSGLNYDYVKTLSALATGYSAHCGCRMQHTLWQ